MTPTEIIETAVKLLRADIDQTQHIPRFSDANKIRREHLRQLAGVLQVSEFPTAPAQWSRSIESELIIARLIIQANKKGQSWGHPVTPPRLSPLPLRV